MKKILLIILVLFLFNTAEAQRKGQMVKWLHIAPKASIGTALLINSNTSKDKNIEQSFFNLSTSFGGSLGISIGDYLGFYAEGNFTNFSQKYLMQVQHVDETRHDYDKTLEFSTVNMAVMMRYVSELGGYFEIGPSFTTLKTVDITNSVDLGQLDAEKEDFNASFINLSIGVGQAVYRNERLSIFLGARINFSPVGFYLPREEYSGNTYFKDGAYASNPNIGWADKQNLRYDNSATLHDVQGKTMPTTGFLTLEINYIFGFWGNASCGRGRLLFFQ